ncbi:MAG: hypothetical protein R3E14_11890 [Erythrobacter sp.]
MSGNHIVMAVFVAGCAPLLAACAEQAPVKEVTAPRPLAIEVHTN